MGFLLQWVTEVIKPYRFSREAYNDFLQVV